MAYQGVAGVFVVHTAALFHPVAHKNGRVVAVKNTVGNGGRRLGFVGHTRPESSLIGLEGTMQDLGIGAQVVHPGPGRVAGQVGKSVADGEAVQNGGVVDPDVFENVKGVVGFQVRVAEVTAQDAAVGAPVALLKRGFGAGKAAVHRNSVAHFEGHAALRAGSGLVGARCHPYLVAGASGGQAVVQ